MGQVDSPYTIGVVRVYWDPENGRLRSATVGTTAEICQYRQLDDGSVNVVTCGKQRFCVRRYWIDADGAPCGEVEVIQEDFPLRTPRDAFGTLPSLSNLSKQSFCSSPTPAVTNGTGKQLIIMILLQSQKEVICLGFRYQK